MGEVAEARSPRLADLGDGVGQTKCSRTGSWKVYIRPRQPRATVTGPEGFAEKPQP